MAVPDTPAPAPGPVPPAHGIIVPAAIVDALVGLALSSEAGKGVMLGFRAIAGVPAVPMRLVVQDARLVPEPGGQP